MFSSSVCSATLVTRAALPEAATALVVPGGRPRFRPRRPRRDLPPALRFSALLMFAAMKPTDRLVFYSLGGNGLQVVIDYNEDAAPVAKAAKATCPRRSPVRSELHASAVMAKTAHRLGRPLSTPITNSPLSG